MPKDIEKMIVNNMEDFFNKNFNERIQFSFEIIEKCVYLYIQFTNGKVLKKIDLHIDIFDLNELYFLLSEEIKNKYLNIQSKKIKIEERVDLFNLNNPYLVFKVCDLHKNVIKIELRDYGYQKDSLNIIKNIWIELIEQKRASKTK